MEPKAAENTPDTDCDEKDVGITEFLTPGNTLLARYKSRYSDFIVNEIGLDGQVVKPPAKRDPNARIEEEKKVEEPTTITFTTEQEEAFKKTLKEDDYKKLEKFIEEVNFSTPPKGFKVEMDCPDDKETRKLFHQTLRSLGSSKLDSETFNISGRNMLRVLLLDSKAKKRRVDTRDYPDKYLQFTMLKTNHDSTGAIGVLGKFLQMRPNCFGIAGNKDKRGVTSQRVTLFKTRSEDLEQMQNKKKWLETISIGDYSYVPKQLKLGDLKGNRFALGLRLVQNYEESVIENNIKSVVETGFINYYGLQRFGTTNIKTHTVGKEVLKKNWKGVVELILSAKDQDARAEEVKKKFLQTYDCKEALRTLPNRNKLERYIIEGLKHQGVNNFKNAFMCIPRFTRELYGHAYQSYIWNKAVSRRISKYGKEPIVGDMVIVGEDVEEEDADETVPVDGEGNEWGKAGDKKEEDKEEEKEKEKKEETATRPKFDPTQVFVLTEQTKGNYKLEDLLMPLVGRDVPLPENSPLTEILNEILQEDGLTLKDFENSDQDVFFRGGYRKMVIKPEDVKWDIIKYNNSEQDIQNPYYFTEQEPASEPDGKFQAIRIKFNLKKSAYATMCFRELTKGSTSFGFQIKLNQMSNKPQEKTA